jgi:hypothetical protein
MWWNVVEEPHNLRNNPLRALVVEKVLLLLLLQIKNTMLL